VQEHRLAALAADVARRGEPPQASLQPLVDDARRLSREARGGVGEGEGECVGPDLSWKGDLDVDSDSGGDAIDRLDFPRRLA
jgi:hypothetical protein